MKSINLINIGVFIIVSYENGKMYIFRKLNLAFKRINFQIKIFL